VIPGNREGGRPRVFRLAPMSAGILALTIGLGALPVALAIAAARQRLLALPALLVAGIYLWIWLRFRPTRFEVGDEALVVAWPLKRRQLSRRGITGVRLLDRSALRAEVGWAARVGAGGLFGAFGWLWTSRRGIVQMYVSRTDGLVWIERGGGRPWLVTPERPEAFARALGEPPART